MQSDQFEFLKNLRYALTGALFFMGGVSHAQEIGFGLTTDLHGSHSNSYWFAFDTPKLDQHLFKLHGRAHIFSAHLNSRGQRNANDRPETVLLGIEHRWNLGESKWFLATGFVARTRYSDSLSTRFNFSNGLGIKFGDINVTIRHFSNAGTGGLNRGENVLLTSYSF